MIEHFSRRATLAALLATAICGPALAHHGWTWAEEEQTELTGTITEVFIGPPHPVLTVAVEGDGSWTIELGNPGLTERSGFVDGSATVGDTVTVLGHRSLNAAEKRMKAVRVTIGDKVFDIYPDRIQS